MADHSRDYHVLSRTELRGRTSAKLWAGSESSRSVWRAKD